MQGLNANNPFIDVFGALGTICTGMAKYLYHKTLNLLRDEKNTFYFLLVLLNMFPLLMRGQVKTIQGRLDAKIANVPEGYYACLYSVEEKLLLKTPIKEGQFHFDFSLPMEEGPNFLKRIEVFITKNKDLTPLQLVNQASCSARLLVEEKIGLSGDFQKKFLAGAGALNNDYTKFRQIEFETAQNIAKEAKEISRQTMPEQEKAKRVFSIKVYEEGKQGVSQLKLAAQLKNDVAFAELYTLASSPFLILYDANDLDQVFLQFPASYRTSAFGKRMEEKINKHKLKEAIFKVGDKVPPSSLITMNGTRKNLLPLAKGYYLLDVWASWCAPCRAEMPGIQDLAKKYPQLKVIAIAVSDTEDKWKKAVNEDKHFNFTHLFVPRESDLTKKMGIDYVPRNFIIDQDGTVLAKDLRRQDLDNFVKKLF